mmetsp:Transcript_17690/g.41002  ORF Transcript_17690/g.41002 Transcript_17690/m.41002 type:complete len:327 (-) Transcript_17690:2971-3951(-)
MLAPNSCTSVSSNKFPAVTCSTVVLPLLTCSSTTRVPRTSTATWRPSQSLASEAFQTSPMGKSTRSACKAMARAAMSPLSMWKGKAHIGMQELTWRIFISTIRSSCALVGFASSSHAFSACSSTSRGTHKTRHAERQRNVAVCMEKRPRRATSPTTAPWRNMPRRSPERVSTWATPSSKICMPRVGSPCVHIRMPFAKRVSFKRDATVRRTSTSLPSKMALCCKAGTHVSLIQSFRRSSTAAFLPRRFQNTSAKRACSPGYVSTASRRLPPIKRAQCTGPPRPARTVLVVVSTMPSAPASPKTSPGPMTANTPKSPKTCICPASTM